MPQAALRALVVDDEPQVRTIVGTALANEGFSCGFAVNGAEALERLAMHLFDVVVTDLRMPIRHGHALVQDLLKLEKRPLIVVLTGMDDPRLTKDMIARGVDDIVFKPVNFLAFAAKVKALVLRHANAQSAEMPVAETATHVGHAPVEKAELARISLAELKGRLAEVTSLFPVSQVALEIYSMTSGDDCEANQIATAIERDASLAVELLRIGNSGYYNPAGTTISDLAQIVVRIGRKRIGEVALLMNTLSTLTAGLVSWMDVGTTWRRSVASGIAAELLMQHRSGGGLEKDLVLSAGMHGLGRVVLATLYPTIYETMLAHCRAGETTLEELESKVFPKSPPEIISYLLAKWNVPEHIYLPLRYVADDYSALASLNGPLRTKTELVKLAVLMGQIAAEDWASWDKVDLPPASVIRRLGIHDVGDLIAATHDGLKRTLNNARHPCGRSGGLHGVEHHNLGYYSMLGDSFDFLVEMLACQRLRVLPRTIRDIETSSKSALVNCIGMTHVGLEASFSTSIRPQLGIVCSRENKTGFQGYGSVLGMPASYETLRLFCERLVSLPIESQPTTA
jgi:CheY-like chemotaxis protein/HD-like signal output (HDOD) protein